MIMIQMHLRKNKIVQCFASLSPNLPFPVSHFSHLRSNGHGLIRKYGLNMCRQCFHQYAKDIGFKKMD